MPLIDDIDLQVLRDYMSGADDGEADGFPDRCKILPYSSSSRDGFNQPTNNYPDPSSVPEQVCRFKKSSQSATSSIREDQTLAETELGDGTIYLPLNVFVSRLDRLLLLTRWGQAVEDGPVLYHAIGNIKNNGIERLIPVRRVSNEE